MSQSLVQFQGFGATDPTIDALITAGKLREVSRTAAKPTGMLEMSLADLQSKYAPWYKKWWVWAIVGGVVVAGAGTIWYVRRRRRRRN
jgi:hypothetical protein